MEIEILKGNQDDVDEVELLYNKLNDFLAAGINYPGWKKDVYPTRNDAEEGIHDDALFVAKMDNIIVGSVILNHHRETAYDKVKWLIDDPDYSHIIVIHKLAVHSDHLHHGIGEALLDFAMQFAKNSGMSSIRLDVYEKNTPAIKLYEKKGYSYIDTVDLGLREYGLNFFKLYEKLI